MPNYAEYVMVFYDKDMFEKQNLPVPTTLEELTAAMDLTYDFIDITMSQPIQDKLRDAGGVPLVNSGNATDEKVKQLADTFTELSSKDRLSYYPDWPAPGYYDVLISAVQKLMTGNASPDQALEEISKPYQENLANIGK